MIDLERSLVELADRLELPGGDRLVGAVVRRIGAPVRHRRPPRRALVIAIAVASLLAVAIVALPGPRHVVARWLGFDSVRIAPGETAPATASSATTAQGASAVPTTVAKPDLDLGPAMTIDAARTATDLPDPTPALLGKPLSVHVVQPPASGQIVMVYAPSDLLAESSVTGVGALVSVIPAQIEEGYFAKALGTTSTVRSVDVDGADGGYWIEGAPHQLFFESDGQFQVDTLRLATNTLLWQRGDNVYRLEADVSLDTALRIAASVP